MSTSVEKVIMTEEQCASYLGTSFTTAKKWRILFACALVQISMNINTSLYSNGQAGLAAELGIAEKTAVWGAGAFLLAYAFGCELWAPWSEELGRFWVLQASLLLVNIFALMVATSQSWTIVLAGRILGGLSTGGGSMTLGIVADMFEPSNQQYAVGFMSLASVGGSILGPIVGGFMQKSLYWRWTMWAQLLFGVFVQATHFFTVPETRSTVIMDREAKKLRMQSGNTAHAHLYGPHEVQSFAERFHWRALLQTWSRPFWMLMFEPIVLFLSALSGFVDALIFAQIQSFEVVYSQWGFDASQLGLAFISIGIGYVVAWASFLPAIKRNMHRRAQNPTSEHAQFEDRLWWLLFLAPLLPIGLCMFALTASGPPMHWIVSMIAAGVIGIANYGIYMATIDYMVAAYGEYAASATGGNGWSRDFLAGLLTPYAKAYYESLGILRASTILLAISFVLVAAVFIIYAKGSVLRARSSFAQRHVVSQDQRQDDSYADKIAYEESAAVSTSTGEAA